MKLLKPLRGKWGYLRMPRPAQSIGEALDLAAVTYGSREALCFPHQKCSLTYAEWHERALRAAGGLWALGARPGHHLGLLAENRWEWPVVQLAAAMLGAVLVPLNTHYRRDDLAYALRHSRTRVLLYSAGVGSNDYAANLKAIAGELPDLQHHIALDPDDASNAGFARLLESEPLRERPQVDAGMVGSLQYTSGTTGFPKGALLTHEGMLDNAWCTAIRLRLATYDRWTSIIPLFHCAGCIMSVLGCLQTGACYVGVPRFDPVGMFGVIEEERCTLLTGVPTSFLAMLEHPARADFDLSSLRAGTCGGADADVDVLRRCAAEYPVPGLVQVYGQTESSTLVACPDIGDPHRLETVGPVMDECEMRIVEPLTSATLPAGETGEVQMRGKMVMTGYYDNPAATAETVTPDGWLRTGDLGYVTGEGNLVIAGGRLKDLIIRGGENIYPVEVENCLREHAAIEEVAVFAVADEYYGESVGAALKLRAQATSEELAAHCRERIAGFKVPAHWYKVQEFPMTASGKIRKVALRAEAAVGNLPAL